ncbi:FlhC family transcriptional regulator [Cupriavidus necator]|uniref:FlhC family transcriptional regulator n=1 Tax=Cupriavidus necator TaxID=106590 RepID=UPI0030F43D50
MLAGAVRECGIEIHFGVLKLGGSIGIATIDMVGLGFRLTGRYGAGRQFPHGADLQATNDDTEPFESDSVGQSSTVLGSPFLVFAPTLETPADWACFTEGSTSTLTFDRLAMATPGLTPVDKMLLEQYNRLYVGTLYDVLNMSVLAAPLLGISNELAEYLRTLPQHRVELAISSRAIPLFKWRFANPVFWAEASAGRLSSEVMAHYLMEHSPVKADKLPHSGAWGGLRMARPLQEAYAEAFVYFKCRAKGVASLFNMNVTTVRQMYLRIHGESSPSGHSPTSSGWYLDSAGKRLQSTFHLWLFRSAFATGATIPEAFISAVDIGKHMFGDESKVTADRAFHLLRSMATEHDLDVRACRTCGTAYLTANGDLAHSVLCPSCSGTLTSPNVGRVGRTRPRKKKR